MSKQRVNLPPGAERKIINTMVKQQITTIDDGWRIKGTNFESVCRKQSDDTNTWTFIDGDKSVAFSFDMLRWDSGEVIKYGAEPHKGRLEETDTGVSITYDLCDGVSIEIIQDHYCWQKVVHIASLESLGKIPADARWLEVVFSIDECDGLKEGVIDAPAKIAGNSRLHPVKAWDEKDNSEVAFGEIRNGKMIKRIPVEWLLTAEYTVHTDATITYGAESTFNAASSVYTDVAALDATHFVVAYRDAGNSNYGTAVVGVISGTTVSSYGAENVFNTASIYYAAVAALDSTHFVVVYRDNGNSDRGTAIVGVVSGVTISSYGASNVFDNSLTYYPSVAALDATHFVVVFRDSGNSNRGTAIVGVVSGVTISSYGAANVFNTNASSYMEVAALDSTHFVVVYRDNGNSDWGTAIVGVVSGVTISSYGAANVFNTGNTYRMGVGALDSTHFVVAYSDGGSSSHGTAIVGVVSGVTISSYGTAKVFNEATTGYVCATALDSSNFAVSYSDFNSDGVARAGVVSGTTISYYGAKRSYNTGTAEYLGLDAFDATHIITSYRDAAAANHGIVCVGLVSSTSIPNIMHHLRQQGIS